MANNVIWSALYLGNFADIDTDEGNNSVEDETDLLGTYGGPSDQLFNYKTAIDTDSPNDSIDRDDFGPDGTLTYDVGGGSTTQVLDSIVVYRGDITYMDGTTATNVEMDFIQLQNGDVFLIASDNQPYMGTKAIQSIDVQFVVKDDYDWNGQAFFNGTEFVCFACGTLILTPQGEVPVETLAPDDWVTTVDHGPRKLLWTGARTLIFPASPESQKPVEIKSGALGPNLPHTALVVSPQHSLHCRLDSVDEGLCPAKSLIPLKGVRSMAGRRAVTYHSLLFDRHELVYANGLAAESFFPGPYAFSLLSPTQCLQIISAAPHLRKRSLGSFGDHVRPRLSVRTAQRLAQTGHLSFDTGLEPALHA